MTQRRPRLHDAGYLAWLRTKPCCACGKAPPCEAAHIRMTCLAIDKPITGMGRKPDDKYALSLCAWCHREGPESQHNIGDEADFWAGFGIDPFEFAAKYYDEYGGAGGKPRKPRTTINPRLPKEQRQKIPNRKTAWPSRRPPRRIRWTK